ncbi:MAG: precorrin-4 C(11)-methyltransferase [Thermodesulfobacteriota bacterium]
MDAERNIIHFVGAGPGDPELITVKGRRLLEAADLVVYAGSLVPQALVADLRAEIVSSAPLDLGQIIDVMAAAWRQGRKVVRLHTGDPSLYGAIREQMEELDRLAIPHAVVPGVSSAFAAAAALEAELTLPEVSQTVIITRLAGRTPVPAGQELVGLASHRATMLIFLSVGMIDEVVAELLAGGYPASTPVAVVEKASWPEERIIRASLAEIGARVRAAAIRKTAIICVGEVFGDQGLAAVSRLYDRAFAHGCRDGAD